MKRQIIASDIGGTSSRFAHFVADENGDLELVSNVWLKTGEAKSFAELLEQLRATDFGLRFDEADFAAFAVAGPIEDGVRCSPPNIKWSIDLLDAQKQFGIRRAALLNDFLAQAYSAASPIGKRARCILSGENRQGTIAVIGAGTGLGKALLVRQRDGSYIGVPSEGGHATFGPESEEELGLFAFMRPRVKSDYPSWEDLVSGRGLSSIHAFLTGEDIAPAEVAAKFDTATKTFEWASRFYGRACRNFALETLAVGGVYLAGGVAAKNPGLILSDVFRDSFWNSAVHGELLREIPVYLIEDEQSGLWGAAFYASLLC